MGNRSERTGFSCFILFAALSDLFLVISVDAADIVISALIKCLCIRHDVVSVTSFCIIIFRLVMNINVSIRLNLSS